MLTAPPTPRPTAAPAPQPSMAAAAATTAAATTAAHQEQPRAGAKDRGRLHALLKLPMDVATRDWLRTGASNLSVGFRV